MRLYKLFKLNESFCGRFPKEVMLNEGWKYGDKVYFKLISKDTIIIKKVDKNGKNNVVKDI